LRRRAPPTATMEGFLGVTRQLLFTPLKALGKRARSASEGVNINNANNEQQQQFSQAPARPAAHDGNAKGGKASRFAVEAAAADTPAAKRGRFNHPSMASAPAGAEEEEEFIKRGETEAANVGGSRARAGAPAAPQWRTADAYAPTPTTTTNNNRSVPAAAAPRPGILKEGNGVAGKRKRLDHASASGSGGGTAIHHHTGRQGGSDNNNGDYGDNDDDEYDDDDDDDEPAAGRRRVSIPTPPARAPGPYPFASFPAYALPALPMIMGAAPQLPPMVGGVVQLLHPVDGIARVKPPGFNP
jgi:hypothetical protein